MGCEPLVRRTASTREKGTVGPRDNGRGPLAPNERDRMRVEYGRPGKDHRVLRLLDEREQLQAALARELERAEEAESRLIRRVRQEA
jgi:hypothetical protein